MSIPRGLTILRLILVPILTAGLISLAGTAALAMSWQPAERVLHTFVASGDGEDPGGPPTGIYGNYTSGSPIVQDRNGDLYGTTASGGHYGDGTVYRLTTSGG